MSEEDRNALKTPTTTAQLDLAPTWIFWYGDTTAPSRGQTTLKQLVDVGALNPSHGWSHAYVDNVIWTQVLTPIMSDPGTLAVVTAVEAGVAVCPAEPAGRKPRTGDRDQCFQCGKGEGGVRRPRPSDCPVGTAGGLPSRIVRWRWPASAGGVREPLFRGSLWAAV